MSEPLRHVPYNVEIGMTDGQAESAYTYAVWYVDDDGCAVYALARTEQEAAEIGAWVDDGDTLGLQRADGTTTPASEWEALTEAKHRQRQAEQDRRDNSPPPPPTRRAQDPFEGRLIDIDTSEPNWLGGMGHEALA